MGGKKSLCPNSYDISFLRDSVLTSLKTGETKEHEDKKS